MWGELANSLRSSNGYIIFILIAGFLGTTIFFERLLMLQFVYHIDFHKFLGNLKKMVGGDDLGRAISLCKSVSSTALPRISLKALEAAETDPTKIKGTIEEEVIDFLPNIEKRIHALPAFTLLILMTGILGTIDSLWHAFQSVDVLDSARKQATLAQGIASALNPTAIGLMFGMLLLAGHHLLKSIAANVTERIHYGVTVLINLLVPQEMAFVSVGAAPPPTANSDVSDSAEAAPSAAEGEDKKTESAEESFDDVSVEDIKDEEEII